MVDDMNRPTPGEILTRTLRQTEAEREAIMGEALDGPNIPQRTTFFDHVVQTFYEGSEERMFTEMNINRVFFDAAFNLVDSVPLRRRGRPSFVSIHRDKLLFLLIFLTRGKVLWRKHVFHGRTVIRRFSTMFTKRQISSLNR